MIFLSPGDAFSGNVTYRCASLAFARRPVMVRGTLVHPGLAGFQAVRRRARGQVGARRRSVPWRRGQHDGVRVRATGVQQDSGQRGDAQADHGRRQTDGRTDGRTDSGTDGGRATDGAGTSVVSTRRQVSFQLGDSFPASFTTNAGKPRHCSSRKTHCVCVCVCGDKNYVSRPLSLALLYVYVAQNPLRPLANAV